MQRYSERYVNVDADLASSFTEDEAVIKPVKQEEQAVDWQQWINMFNKNSEEKNDEETKNPFSKSKLGETENKEPEPQKNFFDKAGDWMKENPMTALLGAILIGSAGYLLYKHFSKAETSSDSSERRKRRPKSQEKAAEASEFSLTKEEITVGIATAAGGAIIGTVLNDYSVVAAIPAGVVGVAKESIPLMAVAFGLILGGAFKEIFKGYFQSKEEKKENELKGQGIFKTILGYLKL